MTKIRAISLNFETTHLFESLFIFLFNAASKAYLISLSIVYVIFFIKCSWILKIICNFGVLKHFLPGIYFDLDILKHFELKNQTRKIVTIKKKFELYQAFMYNFLCQTVLIFTIYLLFTIKIETFWSRDITDMWFIAHFELKIYKFFWTSPYVLNRLKYFLI